jgi:hypothetical protein
MTCRKRNWKGDLSDIHNPPTEMCGVIGAAWLWRNRGLIPSSAVAIFGQIHTTDYKTTMFCAFIAAESKKWAKLIKDAGVEAAK